MASMLTISQAAEARQVPASFLRSLIARGVVQTFRVPGERTRYHVITRSLDDYLSTLSSEVRTGLAELWESQNS